MKFFKTIPILLIVILLLPLNSFTAGDPRTKSGSGPGKTIVKSRLDTRTRVSSQALAARAARVETTVNMASSRPVIFDVESFTYAPVPPMAQSSKMTGRPVQPPIVFIKKVDETSGILMEAYRRQTKCEELIFRFFRPGRDNGKEENYYSITLTNAQVTGITQDGKETALAKEKIEVRWQDIRYVFHEGGIETTDLFDQEEDEK